MNQSLMLNSKGQANLIVASLVKRSDMMYSLMFFTTWGHLQSFSHGPCTKS